MQKTEVPFFARFLENQEAPQARAVVKAGREPFPQPILTMKYPSDEDEDGGITV